MKTRDRDQTPGHGLPPPPAPTARDANPWTMPDTGNSGTGGPAGARPGTLPASEPGAPRHPRFPVRQVPYPKPRKPPVVPVLILAVAAIVALGAAFRALAAGAVEDAIGPMIVFLFVAFIAVRMLRGRRS
jgi:hypothetical protein